jgi:hypothetical protein
MGEKGEGGMPWGAAGSRDINGVIWGVEEVDSSRRVISVSGGSMQ